MGFSKITEGKVWLFGNDVDTDQILPGYAMAEPIDKLKDFTLAGSIHPEYAKKVQVGDIIIAGKNFGSGSSREQAPVALKNAGTGIVIAKSLAMIFRKNSINIGLPVVVADLVQYFQHGDRARVDIEQYTITNLETNQTYSFDPIAENVMQTLKAGGLIERVRQQVLQRTELGGNQMQVRTKEIIRQDIEKVRAYARVFSVEMPDLDENGEVVGLPAPYPREVQGVVRGGHRIAELGRKALQTGIPCLNPILGRNSAEETLKESQAMDEWAEKHGVTFFQFVHSEATRHIDPLAGEELINQSRGKGGITPGGEREFIKQGGGAIHPLRINATGDTPHLSIINSLIAGFDGTDIGPVIHVHFGGRGIHDYRTKVENGYKALVICAENNIFVQLDSHKHINNIEGTDGMALAMCKLSEGLAVLAGLPKSLSAIQMNVAGINLLADLALMRAFRESIWSEFLIVVPETFQNPPGDLMAEQGHFARMAVSAKLGGANFYRPKAAESVGIPTGLSMSKAMWASQNIFESMVKIDIHDPYIDARKEEIIQEALAVLTVALEKDQMLSLADITEDFWKQYTVNELIDLIVKAGKSGILDTPRAGGWDLKRAVKTHRDQDGIRRYVKGYTPYHVDEKYMPITKEPVQVPQEVAITKKEKVLLATVGADAHVVGIGMIKEAFVKEGYEVIHLKGMNLPETVAEVAAEANVDVVGVSNLLGLGVELFPRVSQRLTELGLREKVILLAGGRIAEKEEDHAKFEKMIATEGTHFLGVDQFFGPGTNPEDVTKWVQNIIKERE